jgi:hypothetical protein
MTWFYVLIAMPILTGGPGDISVIKKTDFRTCLTDAMHTTQADLESGNAYVQAVCMPDDDVGAFVAAADCYRPERKKVADQDVMTVHCKGIAKGPP